MTGMSLWGKVKKEISELSLENTTNWYISQVLENEWGKRHSSTERVILELYLEQVEFYTSDKIEQCGSLSCASMVYKLGLHQGLGTNDEYIRCSTPLI